MTLLVVSIRVKLLRRSLNLTEPQARSSLMTLLVVSIMVKLLRQCTSSVISKNALDGIMQHLQFYMSEYLSYVCWLAYIVNSI